MSDRTAYIKTQKTTSGRVVLGVFPAHYPKEILWAMNILPVEIWDPPLEATLAAAHLQPYTCSIVKSGLALVLEKKCRDIDGFLFPHTCDSIQNLASLIKDHLIPDTPCFFFYHPKAPYRESSRRFYRKQLDRLVSDLELHFEPLTTQNFRHAVQQGRAVNRLLHEIYTLRAASKLNASNQAFYKTVRQGEYLHPDDYIPLLRQFLAVSKGETGTGSTPILLSGILPSPRGILSLLDRLSVNVINDDYLCCQRRIVPWFSDCQDPFEAVTASYFAMLPCSTKGSAISNRLDFILRLAQTGGAQGVIFNLLKFCEPEQFDIPQLVDGLKAAGLATLIIDSELDSGVSGQMVTRIEAFIEMIH